MPSQNPPPTEVVEQRQYRVRIQEGEAKLSGGSTAWNKRAAGVRQYNNANRIERRMARGLCRRAAVKPAWEEAYFQPDNVLYKTRMRTRGRNRERERDQPTMQTALCKLPAWTKNPRKHSPCQRFSPSPILTRSASEGGERSIYNV